jgi:REP element-mobilizing transposase RayT
MIDVPPPGFAGLAPSKVVIVRRRHLPHWRQEDATYFVTFRLADSLPQARVRERLADREAWHKAHPQPNDADWTEYHRRAFTKLETSLHEGHGTCCLTDDDNALLVSGAMRHFDGTRCLLGCMVVMGNHVHAVVRPNGACALESLMQSCKRFSATQINRRLGRTGMSLWQEELFDRIVRDTAHLRKAVRYVEKNALAIGRPDRFWIREDWRNWYNGAADVK